MEYIAKNLEEFKTIAEEIIAKTENFKIISFIGKMGVGKTTMISAMCDCWRAIDNVSSPTFSIINEYTTITNEVIYHFDFYRITNLREAREIGIEDYFESGNICLMEWAENIKELLPDNMITIKIKEMKNGHRKIEIKPQLKQ